MDLPGKLGVLHAGRDQGFASLQQLPENAAREQNPKADQDGKHNAGSDPELGHEPLVGGGGGKIGLGGRLNELIRDLAHALLECSEVLHEGREAELGRLGIVGRGLEDAFPAFQIGRSRGIDGREISQRPGPQRQRAQ